MSWLAGLWAHIGALQISTIIALAVLATAQMVFCLLLLVYLLGHRGIRRQRARREEEAAASIAEPMNRWLVGEGSADAVAAYLRALPPDSALEQVTRLATLRVAPERHAALAAAMERDGWVVRALQGARSRRWWKRLAAVRLLAVVGKPAHRLALRRLLLDRHPAVQLAAASCLGRVDDPELVSLVVETLPRRPVAVRHYLFGALRQCWPRTVPLLAARLRADTPPDRLEVWVNLAEVIATPEILTRVLPLHTHAAPGVRLAVARALKHYFHADSVGALGVLLADEDWRVRAQAARALGALHATDAIAALGLALADPAWWVRFRAGLSLAQLGEPGRRVLRAARETTSDQFAREMATMVSGLPDGGVLELADA
jgi:HEAT repeat protein